MEERRSFSRYVIRCGLLVRSDRKSGKILRINKGDEDDGVIIVTGNDLPGDATFDFLGTPIPILARDNVYFKGQPVAAVFAPDYETATLKANSLGIIYDETADDPELPYSAPEPLEYSWGEYSREEGDTVVESEFNMRPDPMKVDKTLIISAWMENSSLHLEVQTQWPHLVREAVSSITGFPARNIVLHTLEYSSKHDEYLIVPSILATLVSFVAVRTNIYTEMKDDFFVARPGIKVLKSSVINAEGRPVAETVKMTVDQGAYSICSSEYQRQAMTGLIPSYPLKSFDGTVEIKVSNNFPASFFSSLGYAEALASREFHLSRISESLHKIPSLYRYELLAENRRLTDYLPGLSLASLNKTTRKATEMSTYERKWAANSLHTKKFGMSGQICGVGLATGTGIAGFSTEFSKELGFESVMSYTKKGNVTINTSFLSRTGAVKGWKNNIAEIVGLEKENSVMLIDYNQDTLDAGPDVLSRMVSSYTPQLLKAADEIKAMIDSGETPPFSVRFDAENLNRQCSFESAGFGTLVVEVFVERNNLIPVVKGVWASFVFSRILNKPTFEGFTKRLILTALNENGVELADDFVLELDLSETGEEGLIASISELSRALVLGALSNALCQIGGYSSSVLPTSATRLSDALFVGKEDSE